MVGGWRRAFWSSMRMGKDREGNVLTEIQEDCVQRLCGICSEGKPIFTPECSQTFHFPCIAPHVKTHQKLTSPFYNDDEPLISPTLVIPETDENQEDQQQLNNLSSSKYSTNLPHTAIVSSNTTFHTIAAVFNLKAAPSNALPHRPPLDLVTVLHLPSADQLSIFKRSMQLLISSLASADRLSVIAFSARSNRLFPLRRMTGRGRRAARRIIDSLAANENIREGASARNEALKKAAKVLEDRRQKNTVATIILLSDGHENQRLSSSARCSHLEIPVRELSYYSRGGAYDHAHQDGAFRKRVENLLRVVAQDVTIELNLASRSSPAEVTTMYCPASGCTLSPDSAVLGDLHAEEEREFLVELKVPAGTSSRGTHHNVLTVHFSYRDPFTQELVHSKEHAIIVPRPHTARSTDPKIQRLFRFHVIARAVAESRRLLAQNDVSGALLLLSSARADILQSSRESADECLRWIEAELRRIGQQQVKMQKLRTNNNCLEEKAEPLTPMSAWRAAQRLAKVAIMRKSMNRVSDLHGFEDARF